MVEAEQLACVYSYCGCLYQGEHSRCRRAEHVALAGLYKAGVEKTHSPFYPHHPDLQYLTLLRFCRRLVSLWDVHGVRDLKLE